MSDPRRVPSVSAMDAPFHAPDLTPNASGARAWDATRPAADALPPAPTPTTDADYAAERILSLWPTLLTLRADTLRRLSPDEQAEVAPAFDSLPRLAFATRYVHPLAAQEPTPAPLSALVTTAQGLRQRGLNACDTLETLGRIASGTAASIRRGQGHQDLADDLHSLHTALTPHRHHLAALSTLATPDAPSLSPDDADRLSHVGSALQLALTQDAPKGPWRQALSALSRLTAAAYDTALAATHYHLKRAKRRDLQKSLPATYAALRRPASSTPPAAPQPPPST